MENYREKVLGFIRARGPVLPVQISKFLDTNIIFAGAILSELAANKHLLISNTKRGGSPFYYVRGQEDRLQEIAINLNGKEKEAYDLLKEKKLVRDNDLLPWQRVALRAIKDFAVPIEVEFQDTKELFWKWYALSSDETNSVVDSFLSALMPKQEILVETKPVIVEEPEQKAVELEISIEPKPTEIKETKPKKPRKERAKQSYFLQDIQDYFSKVNIKITEQYIKKTGKDLDYMVEVPSKVGNLHFYLKAKDKSSITENDLTIAYAMGKQKNLQTLFLSNGTLTKKAKEYLEKNMKGQLTFVSLSKLPTNKLVGF